MKNLRLNALKRRYYKDFEVPSRFELENKGFADRSYNKYMARGDLKSRCVIFASCLMEDQRRRNKK